MVEAKRRTPDAELTGLDGDPQMLERAREKARIAGLWWLDPLVALLIAAVAVKEGREAWRGEGCCVVEPAI